MSNNKELLDWNLRWSLVGDERSVRYLGFLPESSVIILMFLECDVMYLLKHFFVFCGGLQFSYKKQSFTF